MAVITELRHHFVGPALALGLGQGLAHRHDAAQARDDADTSQPRVGEVLRLDLRQRDGATIRVMGIVRSVQEARHDPGQSAVLEYVHPDSELEIVDWVRAWEASALEQVDAMVLLFNRDAELTWANAAVEQTTGWAASELLGRELPELEELLGLSLDRWRILRSLLLAGSWSACVRLRTRSGQPRMVHVRVTAARDARGAIKGVTAIVRDETELHRLRSVAEAVNLATNVGQMFAGIRHELGNPINSLKTALTVLNQNWRRFDDERVDHYLEHMLVEISRVEHLLRSLRTFSAFEDVQLRPCSTRALLRELAPVVETTARERGIIVDVDESTQLWVKADCRALYQALLNLVTNAMDAVTKTHGRVALCARKLGPGTIAIEVEDEGEGIPPEELESVLRPFYTTKAHGSGLGLAIVQRLAHAMGGELVIDSHVGRGTTVRVLLAEMTPDA